MRIRVRYASAAQLAVAAMALLLSVLSIVAFASRQGDRRRVARLKQNPSGQPETSPGPGNKSPRQEQVARIQKRNIFSPPVKKGFSARLIGVLGDEAIFQGGQFVKVGGTVGGAKVTEIGPDWVEVVYEGKPRKLMVFGKGGAPPGPGGPPRPQPGGPPAVRMGPPGRPMGPGVSITPEMIERFKTMPPEIRDRALEHMPPEMRKKLQQAIAAEAALP